VNIQKKYIGHQEMRLLTEKSVGTVNQCFPVNGAIITKHPSELIWSHLNTHAW
jgi:hypothetical protein